MAQFLMIFKLIISILPLVIEAIQVVEKAIPGSGNGDAKLEVIRSTIQESYSFVTENDAIPKFEKFWDVMKNIVSNLVSAFNRSGVFSKSE